jgi:N-acyl homoserine lactone hydrolase
VTADRGRDAGLAAGAVNVAGISITPVYVADLLVDLPDVHMPVYVHVVEHPQGRILVDTGLTESDPLADDMEPQVQPLNRQGFDIGSITAVVNTHLHFDHCGGNKLFAGTPTYVQHRELEDARSIDGYTVRRWVDAPGVTYVELDGDIELLPGVRIVATPGHTPGSQVVVVEAAEGRHVIAGDSAVFFSDLDDPQTEGQRIIRSLDPVAVWLAHAHEPWRPAASSPTGAQALPGRVD